MQLIQHWKHLMAGLVLAFGLLVLGQLSVLAEERTCTGSLGAITVDNLRVPEDTSCTLSGTKVEGTIYVEGNATLSARNVQVIGNIQAENSARVDVLPGSQVGGSIQIVQSGAATIDSVRVNGDLYFDDNDGALIASNNVIGGNLQAFQNTGGVSVTANTIDGNLQCKENNPPPTGGRNQAASFEDQCADFGGDPQSPTPTPVPSPTPASSPSPSPSPTATQQSPGGGDGRCQGVIGRQEFENLTVPDGASCTLNGTRVDGNIVVGTNATLHAIEVSVEGNIQAEGAADVTVHQDSVVGGNIQIKQGGSATVDGVRVTGDIQLESNNSALNATNNQVGGNMQIFQNQGWIAITDNRIDGNLQCKENNPPPIGGRNQATSFEDQCADFDGEPQVPSPDAGNSRTLCEGFIGVQTYETIVVPDGASCTMVGTRATGDVIVGAGSTLKASRLSVDGNVETQGAAVVTIHDNSTVGGSVQILNGDSATVDGVQIAGNLRLESNRRAVAAMRNQIGGDLQANANASGLVLRSNAIIGTLGCQNNTLPPITDANEATATENQCVMSAWAIYVPWMFRQ